MRLARYHRGIGVRVEDVEEPKATSGDLLISTAACGLCSGELMSWYMDRKAPHVLGHEVAGWVMESRDERFPEGTLVFPHHHASCGDCPACLTGAEVHCEKWRNTKLDPGGMAERFRVPADNLSDTWKADDLQPEDAALVEPLACVVKSVRRSQAKPEDRVAVIGLGALGLMHALYLRSIGVGAIGVELREDRRAWAENLGIPAAEAAPGGSYDLVFVCPGTRSALDSGLSLAAPGARVVLFAPLATAESNPVDFSNLYFRDVSLIPSYSCGPTDCGLSIKAIRAGAVSASDVVSHFVGLEELPEAYEAMKRGDILKVMVVFD